MPAEYSRDDVARSFNWLGHRGYTELNAYHPDYNPANREENIKRKLLPKIWYARSLDEVFKFADRYHGEYLVCYSLNERPRIFKNQRGYPRSATEAEIEVSQNLVIDMDFKSKQVADSQMVQFERFLLKLDEAFLDKGFKRPVRAMTGRGYHLLSPYERIEVKEHPDISDRLVQFRDQLYGAFRRELENLEVKVDRTQDLRRMLKIYGTAKPEVGVISRFHGTDRDEDPTLRQYLLEIKLPDQEVESHVLKVGSNVPQWFHELLEKDSRVKELWTGKGKPDGSDVSGSGYDYSLVRRLLGLGYKSLDDLATILALRPEGSIRKSGKGEYYIRRTIAKALLR